MTSSLTRLLGELEALAARLGVEVRVETFAPGVLERRGGLCRVDGRLLVVMDDKLAVADRIGVLAAALAKLDIEGVSMRPLIRDRIEAARTGTRRRPSRSKVVLPGLARATPRRPR